jgi:type 1 glutamine amidotransferase
VSGVDGPHVGNGPVEMPVVWTKYYGKGKVFYNSLGHSAAIVESEPCLTLMRRGFNWAARS